MAKRKKTESQEEQSRGFTETAGELECDESGGTFEEVIREVATDEPPKERESEMTWYVAYSLVPLAGARADQGERLQRFPDEARAKKFANQIATDPKLRIRAGTLPGIKPAKQITETDLHAWISKPD
jgi:hypothetical protein